jgi:hypothetical protein
MLVTRELVRLLVDLVENALPLTVESVYLAPYDDTRLSVSIVVVLMRGVVGVAFVNESELSPSEVTFLVGCSCSSRTGKVTRLRLPVAEVGW